MDLSNIDLIYREQRKTAIKGELRQRYGLKAIIRTRRLVQNLIRRVSGFLGGDSEAKPHQDQIAPNS